MATSLPAPPAEQQPGQHHQRPQDGHLEPGRGGPSQPALERIVPAAVVVDNVQEFGLHELPVKVRDRILVRVLVALQTLALVAPELELAALDRNALWKKEYKKKRKISLEIIEQRKKRVHVG